MTESEQESGYRREREWWCLRKQEHASVEEESGDSRSDCNCHKMRVDHRSRSGFLKLSLWERAYLRTEASIV